MKTLIILIVILFSIKGYSQEPVFIFNNKDIETGTCSKMTEKQKILITSEHEIKRFQELHVDTGSIFAFGQDSDTGFYSTAEGEAVTINLNNQFMINPSDLFVTHNDVFILIKHLEDYDKHCYNDSIKKTYDYFKWGNDTIIRAPSIDPGHSMGYIGRKSIYIHKQPTFKDFIQWIKKQ